MKIIEEYKKQIFTIVTIFLILEFGIYPCLTMNNIFANIIGGIGLLLLLVWGGLSFYQYITSEEGGLVDKEELKEAFDAKTREEFQIKAGIKGDKPKLPMDPEIAKSIGESWTGKLGVEDPLTMIPLSRLSKTAKEKMVEIAMEDIKQQLENSEQLKFENIKNILSNKTN